VGCFPLCDGRFRPSNCLFVLAWLSEAGGHRYNTCRVLKEEHVGLEGASPLTDRCPNSRSVSRTALLAFLFIPVSEGQIVFGRSIPRAQSSEAQTYER
jgi:hypothetical protein